MHIQSFVKIHCHLLKLSSEKENTDGWSDLLQTTDRQMIGQTEDQRETIMPRHYCVAAYKK